MYNTVGQQRIQHRRVSVKHVCCTSAWYTSGCTARARSVVLNGTVLMEFRIDVNVTCRVGDVKASRLPASAAEHAVSSFYSLLRSRRLSVSCLFVATDTGPDAR